MDNSLYTALITASGFIISPLMIFIFQLVTERQKHSREIKKMVFEKKLEAAENFIGEYTSYLDAVSSLAYALDKKSCERTPEGLKYVNAVIGSSQGKINRFSVDRLSDLSRIVLYFDVDTKIVDSETNRTLFNSYLKLVESKARFDINRGQDQALIHNEELVTTTQTLKDLVEKNKPMIEKIIEDIRRELR